MRAVGVAAYVEREVGERREVRMPRYVVERTFPDGWHVPADADGAELCLAIGERNADEGVTWLHSYVSDDRTKSFCVYEAPTPEAIRRTAARNDLPVDVITQVRVLDPYFYD
jgi:Nickel responsive protein SCO4226-like